MNDDMNTVGCLMALERDPKNVLLILCLTTETDYGRLVATARMRELAYMGFIPAAIVRCNRNDATEFAVFALAGLSEILQSALANESGKLIQDALSTKSDETDVSISLSCEPPVL